MSHGNSSAAGLFPVRILSTSRPEFRWFAELDIGRLSGQSLKRPRKSERQAMEFVYSAPKSVSIAAVLDDRIGEQMTLAV